MQAIYSDIQSGINALDLSTKYHITPSAAAKYLKESEVTIFFLLLFWTLLPHKTLFANLI